MLLPTQSSSYAVLSSGNQCPHPRKPKHWIPELEGYSLHSRLLSKDVEFLTPASSVHIFTILTLCIHTWLISSLASQPIHRNFNSKMLFQECHQCQSHPRWLWCLSVRQAEHKRSHQWSWFFIWLTVGFILPEVTDLCGSKTRCNSSLLDVSLAILLPWEDLPLHIHKSAGSPYDKNIVLKNSLHKKKKNPLRE